MKAMATMWVIMRTWNANANDDDTFETLSDEEHEQLINDMAAVRTTLDKVCAIITIF
jgi:hypothetical protein